MKEGDNLKVNIVAICELLDIRQDEIGELFFPTVEKGESA